MEKEEYYRIKELPKKVFVFILIIFFLLAIGCIGFMVLKQISFNEALALTLQSLAFMFTDEKGLTKALQVFLAIFGVIMIGWILQSILTMFFEGHFSEYLKTREFLSNIRKMRNHHIIAGGGRVGEEIARSLKLNKKQYIIIEKDVEKVKKLKEKGFIAIKGDVTDSDFSDLIEAGIKNAKYIILAMPETEKNLLMTMTAKELNPGIIVHARADNPAFVSKLKKAGANIVIVPELAAAEKFLKELN